MLKKTAIIVGGLILLSVTGAILYKFLNTETILNIDMNVIITIIIAFFAILLSMFFYFKANETSNQFYLKSYDIMKELSVLVGRFDARFGEMITNLDNKVSYALEDKNSFITNEEIRAKNEENIGEMLTKDIFGKEEKEQLKAEIEENNKLIDDQINSLRDIINSNIKSDSTSTITRNSNIPYFSSRIKANESLLSFVESLNKEIGLQETDEDIIHDLDLTISFGEDWRTDMVRNDKVHTVYKNWLKTLSNNKADIRDARNEFNKYMARYKFKGFLLF